MKNSAEYVGFLAQMAQKYRGKHCVLVLDNATYHTASIVRQFIDELSDGFQLILLPPYIPELNDIESIWKYVKDVNLANFYFGDTETFRQVINEVFNKLNS